MSRHNPRVLLVILWYFLAALLLLIVLVLLLLAIASLGLLQLLRSLLLLLLSFLLEDLAYHGHFMLLLPRVYVSFECRICCVHNIPFLNYVVADLSHPLVLFLEGCNYSLLFLSFLINGQDSLLKDSQIFFDSRVRFFHKERDLLREGLLIMRELPRRFS